MGSSSLESLSESSELDESLLLDSELDDEVDSLPVVAVVVVPVVVVVALLSCEPRRDGLLTLSLAIAKVSACTGLVKGSGISTVEMTAGESATVRTSSEAGSILITGDVKSTCIASTKGSGVHGGDNSTGTSSSIMISSSISLASLGGGCGAQAAIFLVAVSSLASDILRFSAFILLSVNMSVNNGSFKKTLFQLKLTVNFGLVQCKRTGIDLF